MKQDSPVRDSLEVILAKDTGTNLSISFVTLVRYQVDVDTAIFSSRARMVREP
jgi:hypothetical protein